MENEDWLNYDEEDAMFDKSFPDTYVFLQSMQNINIVNLLSV